MDSNHELENFLISQRADSKKSLKSSKAGLWYKIGTICIRNLGTYWLPPRIATRQAGRQSPRVKRSRLGPMLTSPMAEFQTAASTLSFFQY
jgi:hypothetical protein